MFVRTLSISPKMTSLVSRSLASASSAKTNDAHVQEDDVLFQSTGHAGLITLNRPKQLNALSHSMVQKIFPKLKEWRNCKDLIVMKGNSQKAFCAGGDVVAITRDRTGKTARDYFKDEYSNNGIVASLQKPYLAIIHGIVMGGGVGLSIHGKYRVATETSLFAMPETQIGLFPDVGVSYYLARMPNSIGMFLALTGYRLKSFDLCHAGVATHFCHSDLLADLETEVLKKNSDVEDVLKTFQAKSIQKLPGSKVPNFSLADHENTIAKIFSLGSVEEIVQGLEADCGAFSKDILKLLHLMSPLSLKVTHRQINVAAKMDVYQVLNQDYRLAWRLLAENDFYEGVRALLVEKDRNPKWRPAQISDITEEQVSEFFKPLKPEEELNLPHILHN